MAEHKTEELTSQGPREQQQQPFYPEDISCRMDLGCLTPSPSSTGVFTKDQAAAFYKDLKLHFIGFLVFPRVFLNNPNFSLKIGQVPPVMDPTIAGDVLFDTECEVSTQLV